MQEVRLLQHRRFSGHEIFAGCAELLGGTLLIFPRTATLGANPAALGLQIAIGIWLLGMNA